jgi:hypothetical protein
MTMLNKNDISFLAQLGITEENVHEQIELLKKNDSFVEVLSPAIEGDGIQTVSESRLEEYCNLFDEKHSDFSICKFVPASGAATRMFKRLISFEKSGSEKDYNDGGFYSVQNTFENIKKFAFYDTLNHYLSKNSNSKEIAEKILYSGLGYAGIPKGLIEFHKYSDHTRTAFAEHLYESICLLNNKEIDEIHFTVSPEFEKQFYSEKDKVLKRIGKNLKIKFSFQQKNTDTVALYPDNSLVRNEDGNILLRPGGHGSLLQNLNTLDYDIIFIKNIDNLIHADYLEEVVKYKKLLGGMLIEIRSKLEEIYKTLKDPSQSIETKHIEYLEKTFGADFSASTDSRQSILEYINRPIRVCGMVKNTGEPGGGPFWIKKENGRSLQIIEKAQINENKLKQKECLQKATHFNPVDIVCSIKSFSGEKYNLNNFVDKNACFISEKTHIGKNIKVLEHPGLWNGAMADWLTVFVEIPLITFNPVKELNDLLRKEHQPKNMQ